MNTEPEEKYTPVDMDFSYKRRIYELEQERDALAKSMGMDVELVALESWESSNTQRTRDMFAARALITEGGNQARALHRLGFPILSKSGNFDPRIVSYLATQVLMTTGVKKLINRGLGSGDSWDGIVERQRRTAILGDDSAAAKAAGFLAKMEGKFDLKNQPAMPTVNLHVLVAGQQATATGGVVTEVNVTQEQTHDPLAILAHEPSDVGVRIDSGDKTIDGALAE